ncbi:beta-glucosidase [Clavibacter michiganensis]|uniref:glycoside hydrolase family 3 protein n=1 Tax=Clavibacter michiganensis TaxID=28447 RepID=UPI001AE2B05C|nr:glycoside hydrolase family 3 N-terminal domain-containing protein [Clavibacter michiganensis]MBP2457347.1 beta-glucosidase [Clavibacter michiganensis]MDQ0409917.1 beta-glucosidase [Clavibacter michiganensis]
MGASRARARGRRIIEQTAGGALIAALALGTAGIPAAGAAAEPAAQPELESAGAAPIITVDGLRFRDLDKDGALTPYEDWRLSSGDRAADLVARMSPEERAGLLMHASLTNGGDAYDRAAFDPLLAERHITTYISRLGADAPTLAREHNALQEAAEAERWGVPLKISTDPRHGFTVTEGQTVSNGDFSPFPDPIGMGAVDDPAATLEMGRIIAAEYRAVGITEALSPQADISTEPRWTRQDGTFGSVGADVAPHVAAYVEGLQGGTDGITSDGVATVVKHWVGYGAQVDGYDSHYYYGRYAAFPGGNFAEHITPYEGAFRNQAAGIMPTYSILKDLDLGDGVIEQVGANHNEYLLQDLLRGRFGFDGVITSDWGIANDCPEACRENRPPAFFVGPWGAGMPWGVEDLTLPARYASAIQAGVDIIGGSDQPQHILQAVEQGLLTEARVIEAGQRVLQQKFELGLFEDPYVDPAAADAIVGSAASRAAGLDAQQRSLTLLSDTTPAADARARVAGDAGDAALPVRVEPGMTAWLSGVQASAARSAGFTVVDDPADADVAIVRLADPRGGDDLTDLGFTGSEADYQALVRAHDAGARTIAVPQLTRPLILGNVVEHSDAVLASYGVSDEALLNVITGVAEPQGRLPFELPSTMDAVAAQLYDVPNDSASPLFTYRAGLSYAESPTEPTPAPTPGPVEPTTAPTAAPAPGPVPTPGSASGTTPAPAPAAAGRGGLAMTGFEALPWVAGGLTLAGLGVALTLIARRRRA